MRNIVTGSLLLVGLLLGTATASFASQPIHDRDAQTTVHQFGHIQRADYYYHHNRYHHRAGDRRHHRWHYW